MTGTLRLPHLDNAKAILIVLVVFGHVIELELVRSHLGATVFLLIYLFHMPAFAAVSGYLSRPDAYTHTGIRRTFQLLVAYAVFQSLMAVVMWGSIPHSLVYVALHPLYTMWWLLSIVWWRLLLPLFAVGESALAASLSIATALGLAVAVGTIPMDGAILSVSRTFVFLPFFVAGYRAWLHHWRLPVGPTMLASALACLVGSFVLLFWRYDIGMSTWLLGVYSQDGVAPLRAVLMRLALTVWSSALVIAFFYLVPRSRRPITVLGATTLSVFLWHGLAVQVLVNAGLASSVAGTWIAAIATTGALVLVFGLGPIPALTNRMLGITLGRSSSNGR